MERLQKFLARAGIASRRKSEELITSGRIQVNGNIITELGYKVCDDDEIIFDGNKVTPGSQKIYILLNKPEGYVTTSNDQFARPTVIDLIPDIKERIYPVGRLDYDTSGLLLLTNDGSLTYKLTHPKHNIEKTYIARIEGKISNDEIISLRRGVIIDGIKTHPAKVKRISQSSDRSVIEITISEGRNRQIRKMCTSVGHNVITLKRISIGKLYLKDLEKGKYRFLNDEEIQYLSAL